MTNNQIEITKEMRQSVMSTEDHNVKHLSFEGVDFDYSITEDLFEDQTVEIRKYHKGGLLEMEMIMAIADFDLMVELMSKPLLKKS